MKSRIVIRPCQNGHPRYACGLNCPDHLTNGLESRTPIDSKTEHFFAPGVTQIASQLALQIRQHNAFVSEKNVTVGPNGDRSLAFTLGGFVVDRCIWKSHDRLEPRRRQKQSEPQQEDQEHSDEHDHQRAMKLQVRLFTRLVRRSEVHGLRMKPGRDLLRRQGRFHPRTYLPIASRCGWPLCASQVKSASSVGTNDVDVNPVAIFIAFRPSIR